MKQPREGVSGLDQDSDLLSLDHDAMEHRLALMIMANHLKSAVLVGNAAPIAQEIWERIRNPRIGDLVVEMTALSPRHPENRVHGLGILVERRTEWWETDEEWEQLKAEDGFMTDEDRRTDEAWYVQYGPRAKDICRWTNCMFTAIPLNPHEFDKPLTGTITRDTLVGTLNRSGFNLR